MKSHSNPYILYVLCRKHLHRASHVCLQKQFTWNHSLPRELNHNINSVVFKYSCCLHLTGTYPSLMSYSFENNSNNKASQIVGYDHEVNVKEIIFLRQSTVSGSYCHSYNKKDKTILPPCGHLLDIQKRNVTLLFNASPKPNLPITTN